MPRKSLASATEAEAGAGALILLIASILIASLAATAFIGTTEFLDTQSERTGRDVSQRVLPTLEIESLVAERPSSSGPLQTLVVYARVSSEAGLVDLGQLRAELQDAQSLASLSFVDGAASATEYSANVVRDAPPTFDPADPIATPGDSLRFGFNLSATGQTLDVRELIQVRLLPEPGQPILRQAQAPPSFGTSTRVQLG